MASSRYQVEVTLIGAKDLKNVDSRRGPLRPYAVVWADPNQKRPTRVDPEGDSFPVWDQILPIPLPPGAAVDDVMLHVHIVHASSEDGTRPLIGSAQLRLRDVLDDDNVYGGAKRRSLQLKRPSGRPHGKVDIKVAVRETRYRAPPTAYGVPPPQASREYSATPAYGSAYSKPYASPQQPQYERRDPYYPKAPPEVDIKVAVRETRNRAPPTAYGVPPLQASREYAATPAYGSAYTAPPAYRSAYSKPYASPQQPQYERRDPYYRKAPPEVDIKVAVRETRNRAPPTAYGVPPPQASREYAATPAYGSAYTGPPAYRSAYSKPYASPQQPQYERRDPYYPKAPPAGYPSYGGTSYDQAPPSYGQEGKKKKSKFGGMGTGLAVGALAGVLGGLGLAEVAEYVENKITNHAAEKAEDDLAYQDDSDGDYYQEDSDDYQEDGSDGNDYQYDGNDGKDYQDDGGDGNDYQYGGDIGQDHGDGNDYQNQGGNGDDGQVYGGGDDYQDDSGDGNDYHYGGNIGQDYGDGNDYQNHGGNGDDGQVYGGGDDYQDDSGNGNDYQNHGGNGDDGQVYGEGDDGGDSNNYQYNGNYGQDYQDGGGNSNDYQYGGDDGQDYGDGNDYQNHGGNGDDGQVYGDDGDGNNYHYNVDDGQDYGDGEDSQDDRDDYY